MAPNGREFCAPDKREHFHHDNFPFFHKQLPSVLAHLSSMRKGARLKAKCNSLNDLYVTTSSSSLSRCFRHALHTHSHTHTHSLLNESTCYRYLNKNIIPHCLRQSRILSYKFPFLFLYIFHNSIKQ